MFYVPPANIVENPPITLGLEVFLIENLDFEK